MATTLIANISTARSLGTGVYHGDSVLEFTSAATHRSTSLDTIISDKHHDSLPHHYWLGGERNHHPPEHELKGVHTLRRQLSQEEHASLPDRGMLIRHLRGEKVRMYICV